MIEVKIVYDDDSHTYVIPAEMEGEFYTMLELADYDYCVSFNEKFSQYRRNPDELKLYTDEI